MPLQVPNLDDRRWAELVDSAVALIPRFAPRWTDHNVHDPGITFVELFAWLAEMQIYQVNRVGARHRETFSRLAGAPRQKRAPARVEVLALGDLTASVRIDAGTRLTPLEGDELVFETREPVLLTRSRLQQVVVDDGTEPIDQTEANAKFGIAFLAFGERAPVTAHLRLGFDAFYPDDEPTIRLAVDVFTSDLSEPCGPRQPVDADTAGQGTGSSPVQLVWEFLGPGAQWIPLPDVTDGTAAFSRSGAVTIPVPATAVSHGRSVWVRCRIAAGHYDIEPRLRHIGVNGLPCVQVETVRDELLGRGNGRPDQSFTLMKSPILIPASGSPVQIEVNNEKWEPISAFDRADPAGRQYVFVADDTRVLFGNGVNGRVPMPGQDVRAVLYQTSSGRSGNVAAGLAWRFRDLAVPGLRLMNPEPATGGADPETLNEMELRARAMLSRPHRAVTLDDIERLAMGTPDVRVAHAQALTNCPKPGRITVVVVPKVRPGRTGPPSPASAALLGAVRRHLQQRRLIGDDLRIVGPAYVEVGVSARLRLAKGAGGAAVVERARQMLGRFLGGEDMRALERPADAGARQTPCPTRWPLGRAVFPSEVYAVLDRVTGVDGVSGVTLRARRGGAAIEPDATGAIPVPRIGLVFSGTHDLTIDAGTRAGR